MGGFEVEYVRVSRDTGCWDWARARSSNGYGAAWDHRIQKMISAHRYIYEMLVGPIPDGATLDHLCRNRACVRPSHLEAVSLRENILRGGSAGARALRTGRCKHGHSEWGSRKTGGRFCRPCGRVASLDYQRRKRVSA